MIKIAARVRGLFAGNYPENREDEQLHINNRGDQLVAQGLPELTEIVRLGDSWQVQTATALDPLTAYPTTIAALDIWNGEPGNGKSYIIDAISCWQTSADVTQVDCNALFANVDLNIAAPTDAALVIRSLSGKVYGGKARTQTNIAASAVGNWYPHAAGGGMVASASVAGSSWKQMEVPLRGLYIVPPGARFGIQSVKVAVGAAVQMQYAIRWHEAVLILKT